MKASSANLLSVIKSPKQFVMPFYQRTYSWHQAQCEQLFKDILRISQTDNIHSPVFNRLHRTNKKNTSESLT